MELNDKIKFKNINVEQLYYSIFKSVLEQIESAEYKMNSIEENAFIHGTINALDAVIEDSSLDENLNNIVQIIEAVNKLNISEERIKCTKCT